MFDCPPTAPFAKTNLKFKTQDRKNRIPDIKIVSPAISAQGNGELGVIYTIECENGRYYVGKTTDLPRRWKEHIDGIGSSWTKLHKPIRILHAFACTSVHDEEITTIDMMRSKGIENVRGNIYIQTDLPAHQMQTLKERLLAIENSCFKCGKRGHFIHECPIHRFLN
jgi:hypothetical protein